jgi:hypothetical protein
VVSLVELCDRKSPLIYLSRMHITFFSFLRSCYHSNNIWWGVKILRKIIVHSYCCPQQLTTIYLSVYLSLRLLHNCKIVYQKFCSRRCHLFLNKLHDVSSWYIVMIQTNQEPVVRQIFATTSVVPMFAYPQNTLFQLSIQDRKITKRLSSCNIYRHSVTNARVLTT